MCARSQLRPLGVNKNQSFNNATKTHNIKQELLCAKKKLYLLLSQPAADSVTV